jgi:hypothetical protein
MLKKVAKIGAVVAVVCGLSFATSGTHSNVRVTQHGGFDSGNYFVKVSGDATIHYFNCTTTSGQAILAALLTCVTLGKNIIMVTNGDIVTQLMQVEE